MAQSPGAAAEVAGGQSGYSGLLGPDDVDHDADTGVQNFTRDDALLLDHVCDALQACEIDTSRIEVHVTNGEVVLEGTVGDALDRATAETVAARVPGVKVCHNVLAMDRRDHAATP